MDTLLKKLHDFSRRLELEDSLPCWESQSRELCARISEMTENLQKKEQLLADLETPSFLQRIFGRADAEKEKCGRQIREITSARMAAQWEQKSLEQKIAEGKQELETLADSRAAYEAAKADTVFTPAQESRILMEEISAFAPAAMAAANRTLEALETAKLWLEGENRRNAENAANRLREILSVLPEGVASVGSFLRAPGDFLNANGLDQAQEQIQQVINQLRLLLGE